MPYWKIRYKRTLSSFLFLDTHLELYSSVPFLVLWFDFLWFVQRIFARVYLHFIFCLAVFLQCFPAGRTSTETVKGTFSIITLHNIVECYILYINPEVQIYSWSKYIVLVENARWNFKGRYLTFEITYIFMGLKIERLYAVSWPLDCQCHLSDMEVSLQVFTCQRRVNICVFCQISWICVSSVRYREYLCLLSDIVNNCVFCQISWIISFQWFNEMHIDSDQPTSQSIISK